MDYEVEQVICESCGQVTGVGFLKGNGRIVCSKCASKQQGQT